MNKITKLKKPKYKREIRDVALIAQMIDKINEIIDAIQNKSKAGGKE